jgi:hypothetical protein
MGHADREYAWKRDEGEDFCGVKSQRSQDCHRAHREHRVRHLKMIFFL